MSNLFGYELSTFTQRAVVIMEQDEARMAHRRANSELPRVHRMMPSKDDNTKLVPTRYTPEDNKTRPSPVNVHRKDTRKKKPAHRVQPLSYGPYYTLPLPPSEFLFQTATARHENDIQRAAKLLFRKQWVSPDQRFAVAVVVPVVVDCPTVDGTVSVDTFHHRHFLHREQEKLNRELESQNEKALEREAERQRLEGLAVRSAERQHQNKLASFAKTQLDLVEERNAYDKLFAQQMMKPVTCSPNVFESVGALTSPMSPGQRIEVRSLAFLQSYIAPRGITIAPVAMAMCGHICHFLEVVLQNDVEFARIVDTAVPISIAFLPLACILSATGTITAPMVLSNNSGMFKVTSLTVNVEVLSDNAHVEMKTVWKPPTGTAAQVFDLLYVQPQRQGLVVMSVVVTVGDRKFKTSVIGDAHANQIASTYAQRRAALKSTSTDRESEVWSDAFECDGTGHVDMLLLPVPRFDRSEDDFLEVVVKYLLKGHNDRQGITTVLPLAFSRLALLETTARKGLQDIGECHIVYGGLNSLNSKTLKTESIPKSKLARGTTNRTLLFAEVPSGVPWPSRDASVSFGIEKQTDFNLLCWIEAGPTATRRDNFSLVVFPPSLSHFDGALFNRKMVIVLDIESVSSASKENFLSACAVLIESITASERFSIVVVLADGYTSIAVDNAPLAPQRTGGFPKGGHAATASTQRNVTMQHVRSAMSESAEVKDDTNPFLGAIQRSYAVLHETDAMDDDVRSVVLFTTRAMDPDTMRSAQILLEGCGDAGVRLHTCTSYQPSHNSYQSVFWRHQSHLYKGEHAHAESTSAELRHFLEFVLNIDRPVLVDIEISFPGLSSMEMHDTRDLTLRHVAAYSGKYTYQSSEKIPEHVSFNARCANNKIIKKRAACLRLPIPIAKAMAVARTQHLQMTSMVEILHAGGHFRDMNADVVNFASQFGIPFSPEAGMGTSFVFYETLPQPKVMDKDKKGNSAGAFLNTASPGGSIAGKSWPEYHNYTVSSEVQTTGMFLTIGGSVDVKGNAKSEASHARKWVQSVVQRILHFEGLMLTTLEEEASERYAFDLQECTEFTNMKYEWNVKRIWITDQRVILDRFLFGNDTMEQSGRVELLALEGTEWRDFLSDSMDTQTKMAFWIDTSRGKRTDFFVVEARDRQSLEDHQVTLWCVGSALIHGEAVTRDLVTSTLRTIGELRRDVDDVIYSLHVLSVWACMRLAGELCAMEGAVAYLKWCIASHRHDRRVVSSVLRALTNLALLAQNQNKLEGSAIVFEVVHSVTTYFGDDGLTLIGLSALCSLMTHSTDTRSIVANSREAERLLLVPLVNYSQHVPITRRTFELAWLLSTQQQAHHTLVSSIVPIMCSICLLILPEDVVLKKRVFEILANVCVGRTARVMVADVRVPLVLVVETLRGGNALTGSMLSRIVKCLDKMTGNTADAAAGCILECCADTLHNIFNRKTDVQWSQGNGASGLVLIEVQNFLRRLLLVTPALPDNVYAHTKKWTQSTPSVVPYFVPFSGVEVIGELHRNATPYRFALPFRVAAMERNLLSFSTSLGVVALIHPEGLSAAATHSHDATVMVLREAVRAHATLFHPNLCCLVGWSLHDDVMCLLYPLPSSTAAEFFIGGAVTWETTMGVFWDIVDALDYLHTCGVPHRRLNVSTIYVDATTHKAMLSAPFSYGAEYAGQDVFTEDAAGLCLKSFRDDVRDVGQFMLSCLVGHEEASKGRPEGCPASLWEGVIVPCLGPTPELTARDVRQRLQTALQHVLTSPMRNQFVV